MNHSKTDQKVLSALFEDETVQRERDRKINGKTMRLGQTGWQVRSSLSQVKGQGQDREKKTVLYRKSENQKHTKLWAIRMMGVRYELKTPRAGRHFESPIARMQRGGRISAGAGQSILGVFPGLASGQCLTAAKRQQKQVVRSVAPMRGYRPGIGCRSSHASRCDGLVDLHESLRITAHGHWEC